MTNTDEWHARASLSIVTHMRLAHHIEADTETEAAPSGHEPGRDSERNMMEALQVWTLSRTE